MTVTVYTSNGSMSALPDVVTGNPDYATALATLNAAGFSNVQPEQCEVVEPASPNVGKVVSSNPAPGTIYKRTKGVILGVGQLVCP
jgi:beta-lactam-binding protein with PASTA domain